MAVSSPALPLLQRFFRPNLITVGLLLVAALMIIIHDHAVARHGADAKAIRECLDGKGPYQLWRANDGETFYRLCHLDDGRWGLQAIIKKGGDWHEKTAFIRGDGSWRALMDYLQRFATRFTGSLP